MRENALDSDLQKIIAHAHRVATALGYPVTPRELFVAAVTVYPDIVIARAQDQHLDLRRFEWALREWGPIDRMVGYGVAKSAVANVAQAMIDDAAQGPPDQACRKLVEQLLDPTRLADSSEAEHTSQATADPTAVVLSRLRLI